MNVVKLNNDQKLIKSKITMKKTKETEQYSKAKTRMLTKPSPRIFTENESCSRFVKTKLAKPHCHIMLNKLNSKQKTKKINGKRKLLVQIENF